MSRRRAKARKAARVEAPDLEALKLPHGNPAPPQPKKRARASGERPEVDAVRLRGRYTSIGYRAATIADREGRSPSRAGARAHERVHRLRLQYESREFVRNNGLYRGMLARARAYIVGRGFKLVARSKSKSWNKKVEKAWKAWWKRPEITGQLSGPRLEGQVMDEILTCGEVGVIPTKKELLQVVEAEQIMGLEWAQQGIERDRDGRPTKFWVSPYDPLTGAVLTGEARAYSPDTFFYISCPERPSSNRAVPPCQASFPMLHRINDVCDSEAISWQMQARVALISNRTSGPMVPTAIGAHNTARDDEDGEITRNYFTELDYALIFHGKPGETVQGMVRTSPGSSFSESLTMFFRLLGLPLGLPLELILLDWTKSNYSQSRAVLEQAFTTFMEWQELLVDLFHDRVYEWWLKRAIARGEIEDREDADEHSWITPTFPWIDQLLEAEAQGEKVDRGFSTHEAVLKSLNADRDEFLVRRAHEVADAILTAQAIFDETGVLPPWESFAGMKAPTQKMTLKDGDGDGQADDGTTDASGGDKPKDGSAKPPRKKPLARRPKASARRLRKAVLAWRR